MLGLALQSVCKAYPAITKEHLIFPLMMKLDVHPSRAQLLAVLSPTPLLSTSILPPLLLVLQQLLTNSMQCAVTKEFWGGIFTISSSLLDAICNSAQSAPLTLSIVDSLLILTQKAANIHWKCCSVEVQKFIATISSLLSYNAQHATDRLDCF